MVLVHSTIITELSGEEVAWKLHFDGLNYFTQCQVLADVVSLHNTAPTIIFPMTEFPVLNPTQSLFFWVITEEKQSANNKGWRAGVRTLESLIVKGIGTTY